MSVLASAAATDNIGRALLEASRPIFAAAIWAWFDANQDDVLFEKRILGLFSVKLVLRDFRFLIEKIAGPDPSVSNTG